MRKSADSSRLRSKLMELVSRRFLSSTLRFGPAAPTDSQPDASSHAAREQNFGDYWTGEGHK
jgi:hypothetical protein